MQIAFKNSFYAGKFDGIYGIGISLRNWLSGELNTKAHVEAVFVVTKYMINKLRKLYPGQFLNLKPGQQVSYSSIETDTDELGNKTHGCRFKAIQYTHYERWDFLPWNITDKRFPKQWPNIQTLFDYCYARAGKVGYDWEGIAGQAIGIDAIDDKSKTFCSEEIGELMGFTCNPSPAKLYTMMRNVLASQQPPKEYLKTPLV